VPRRQRILRAQTCGTSLELLRAIHGRVELAVALEQLDRVEGALRTAGRADLALGGVRPWPDVPAPTSLEPMDHAIETHGLWKTFGQGPAAVHAVRGVDLSVARGEFAALMGPSGCGKSTLLHLLGGLDTPTDGAVRVDGHHLDGLSESERAVLRRRTIGFVFQAYNLVPNLTVADNVDLPGLLAGRSADEVASRRRELLADLGLADRADALPTRMSGGQQQRAAVARALVNRPTVLLADEPTGNLDSASGRQVLDLLARLHASGQTIVVVTHDPLVASQAQRVLFMRDGEVVDELRDGGASDPRAVMETMARIEALPGETPGAGAGVAR
jgi:putative ABC transport system ATP-binding protein